MSTTTAQGAQGDASPEPRHASLEPYDVFVAGVRAECADPGTQQALRRGLAKPVDEVPVRTHAALLRKGLVPDGEKGSRRRAFYAVAALIAARPRAQRLAETDTSDAQIPAAEGGAGTAQAATVSGGDVGTPSPTAAFRPLGTSLGESLALAVARQGSDGIKEEGAESRLHLMVRQDVNGIHRMLPGMLRQLGSTGIATDYACLLRDLIAWRYHRVSVATRWLEDYYRTLRRERAASAAAAEARRGSHAGETDHDLTPSTD